MGRGDDENSESRGRTLGQGRHQVKTGIGMVFFGYRQLRKFFIEAGTIT